MNAQHTRRTGTPRSPLPAGVSRYRGRAGVSAQVEFERLRTLHRLAARRRLRRALIVPGVLGVLAALVLVVAVLTLSGGVSGTAAALLGVVATVPPLRRGWAVWAVPEEVDRWRRGAVGERATAVTLRGVEALGWPVLHDRTIPGSAANIDHLVVGPGGVFVLDSKHWTGQLHFDGGQLWRARLPLGGVSATADWESQQVVAALAPLLPEGWVVPVRTVVVVHGAVVPDGAVTTTTDTAPARVVTIVGGDVLSGWLDQQSAVFTAPQRALLASFCEQALPPYTTE